MLDGRIFPQISTPFSLINTCQMSPISAGSISLDSTFNKILLSALLMKFKKEWEIQVTFSTG
jgi:hypothetical protein